MKFYAQIGMFTKKFLYLEEIIFERVIFGRSAFSRLHLTLSFRTAKNVCPNFQKPPLPSKIPGYAPATYILFELKKYRGAVFHETEEGY